MEKNIKSVVQNDDGKKEAVWKPLKFYQYVVYNNNTQTGQGDALFQKQPQRPMDDGKAVSCVKTDPQGWRDDGK